MKDINKIEAVDLVTRELGGRRLLYLALSGSHAWGLEREDSDIDLRGVYQDPTEKILSLHPGKDTIEFSVNNYDVQLYEVKKFFNMLCKHNGNMVRLLWLPTLYEDNSIVPWLSLGDAFVTKKLRNYFRGYAEGQRKRAMSQRGGKALLYTYSEMFSGLWAMYYGIMEHNFIKLWDMAYLKGWYKGKLLVDYWMNRQKEITDEGWHKFYSEWEQLCDVLNRLADESHLPESYDGYEHCNELLLKLRRQGMSKWQYQ